ncbi:arginase family protein [Peredibacter sp. HCB2-198]|uniref:arginase family protein n=1 Tax=Peredibacter sp. HCB2-198 TaxID=3383025 RepID=UPI0038B61721
MTKPEITQSQKRFQESVGALFHENKPTFLFIKSSTDLGVIRNGGRNGARFAPQSFLSTFKKFSQDLHLKEQSFLEFEVSDEIHEKQNFHEAQIAESQRIEKILKDHPGKKVCHIGGGHDHIYPLLRAYSHQYKKIVVLNIDAHADTRTDTEFHSGTPFRQFSTEFDGDFFIFQIGLHPFANSFSTLSPLNKGKSVELFKKDLNPENLNKLFKQVSDVVDEKTLVVFSLDADALNGYEVPGVSAVNPAGISRTELLDLWKRYTGLKLSHAPVLGIYELNPLYDSLASISMRNMASFVFEGF